MGELRARRAGAALVAFALVLTGCGRGEDAPSDDVEVATDDGDVATGQPPVGDAPNDGPRVPADTDTDDGDGDAGGDREPDEPLPASRAALVADLEALVADAAQRGPDGAFGVLVTDEGGREVVALRPDVPQVPASTLKVVTSAAILTTLGPQARLTTRVEATEGIDAVGRLAGDLVLVGGGDPTLVTDEYAAGVYPARPRTSLADLADQLVDLGLNEVDGDLHAVAPGYDHGPLPAGWPDRYLDSFDGRHLAGLTVDAGLRTLTRYPEAQLRGAGDDGDDDGDDGDDPAGPVGDQDLDAVTVAEDVLVAMGDALGIDGTLRSVAALREAVERDELDLAQVDGTVLARLGAEVVDLGPVDTRIEHATDPTAHAGAELRRLLRERGVRVDGEVVVGPPPGPVLARLATVASAPVEELLRFTIQRSDNHLADQLFLLAARTRTGMGDFGSGERALTQVLERFGIASDGVRFADGSGLSRDDRLTPRQLVDLDRALSSSARWGTVWPTLQAEMGVSGTLQRRLGGTVAEGRFLGKTGTLRDVTALSGQVTASERGPDAARGGYHLAILAADDDPAKRAVARALADELILTLVADLDGCQVRTPSDGEGPLGRAPREVRC